MAVKKPTALPVVPEFQYVCKGAFALEPNPELVKRAVEAVRPASNKTEECAEKIRFMILLEGHETYINGPSVFTWQALPNKKERRKLTSLVAALRKASRILNSLPTEWQQVLFLLPGLQSDPSAIVNGHIVWPGAADRLVAFRQELETLTRRGRAFGQLKRSQLEAGPAEQVVRGDARKRHAANCAFDLLYEFRGAVARDGRFRSLASIIYEGFSGAIEEDLDQQCRAILAHHRQLDRPPG